MTRVTVLHPWLPQYRVPFFRALSQRLEREGIELTVAHGEPPAENESRGDAREEPWAVRVRTHRVGRGRSLLWHDMRGLIAGRELVIVEQAIRNLEAYPLVVRGRISTPRVAFWGHGRTFTKPHTGPEVLVKRLLTNQAHWFFAYTQGGADHVAANGFAPDRITVVQNSIDTETLRARTEGATDADRSELRQRLGIPATRYLLYIGGLDRSKRLSFLIEAARRAVDRDASLSIVVAGAGDLRASVEAEAERYPWLHYVGPVFGVDKAVLASMAEAIVLPGRVGLAVVDAFATGSPVITTDWPYHAPEFEYLRHGVNGWITSDDVDAFSEGLLLLWGDRRLRATLVAGCSLSAGQITLDAMVDNFAGGVARALERSAG